MGMSTTEWARYLGVELGTGRDPGLVAQEVVAEMDRRYDTGLPLMPGAVDAVRRMAAYWPLGVASSSPRRLIDRVLDTAGLTDAFAASVSTEEVTRGKPAPDVYLTVSDRLGVPPESAAAVEDSSNGIRSAAAAGLAVLACPHPRYPVQPDALALADRVLAGLAELTEQAVRDVR